MMLGGWWELEPRGTGHADGMLGREGSPLCPSLWLRQGRVGKQETGPDLFRSALLCDLV